MSVAGHVSRRGAVWAPLLARLRAGHGRVVLIAGETGSGKSVLVDDLRKAHDGVLYAAADESAEVFPLRLLADALDQSMATTSLTTLSADELVFAVEERCTGGPVVLVLEDLQWADRTTVAAWRRLAALTTRRPLLLVGTAGPAPRRPDVQRLNDATRDHAGLVVELGPLTDDEARALAGPDAREVDLSRAGGNPRYVKELAAAGGALSDALVAVIGRRLGYLDLDSLLLLGAAALLGPAFDVRELAMVTGRPVTAIVHAIAEARAAGLLAPTRDDRLAFRHGVIHQVLVEQMPGSVRLALHRQFAEVLAGHGAPLATVARHLLAVPGAVDAWVGRWLADLPEATLHGELEVAASLLERVIGAPHAVEPQRTRLAARLVSVLFALGRDAEVEPVALDVLRNATDPELRATIWMRRLRAVSRLAKHEQALRIVAAALEDSVLPGGLRARIRAWSAVVLFKDGRPDEARRQALLALAQGQSSDPVATAYARHALSHLERGAMALAHVDAGLAALDAESDGDPDAVEVRLLLLDNRLAHLNNLGRHEEFEAAVGEVLELAERAGPNAAARLLWAAAMGSYDFGAWDEALARLDALPAAVDTARLVGRHGLAALIAAHREDWPAMQRHAYDGDQVPITAGDARIFTGYLVAAHAMRAEADGDRERAVRELSVWLDRRIGRIGLSERYMWLPSLVRLALSVDDRETADAAVAAAQEDAARPGALAMQIAAADLCLAQRTDDVPALRRVAEAYRRHGWPLGAALALEEAAVRLAAGGDLDGGRAALNDAALGYAAVGATWDLRRAGARLRALGVRRGPRGGPGRTGARAATGWDALTPTERRIAELVSYGRSNPDIAEELFLSRRTVQTHVSHILAKLKLRSRGEIIRESARSIARRDGMGAGALGGSGGGSVAADGRPGGPPPGADSG
jgi:DNA-binding CsgD family transcriptional regulator